MTIEGIKDFMTTNEAAEYTHLTQSQICWICKHGGFPGVLKFGQSWAIPRQSVIDYKPGPQGFAATQAEKRRQAAAELAEMNAAIRAAKGLPPRQEDTGDTLSGILISVEDAANIFGLSRRYLRQICAWGNIKGAQKLNTNKSWAIPYDELKRFCAAMRRRIKRPPLKEQGSI